MVDSKCSACGFEGLPFDSCFCSRCGAAREATNSQVDAPPSDAPIGSGLGGPSTETPRRILNPRSFGLAIGAIVLCYIVFYVRHDPDQKPLWLGVSEAFGGAIAGLLIAFLIACILGWFVKREARRRSRAIAFIIVLTAFFLLAARGQCEQYKRVAALKSSVTTALEDKLAHPGLYSPVFSPLDTHDEFEQGMIAILDFLTTEGSKLSQGFAESMQQLDSDAILSRTIFEGREAIVQAKERTKEFERSLESLEARWDNYFERADEMFTELGAKAGDSQKSQTAHAGYRSTAEPGRARNRKAMRTYHQYAATLSELLDFLIQKQERYDVQDRKLMFHESSDAITFNKLGEKLDSSAQGLQRLVVEDREATKHTLRKLKPD